MDIFHKCDGFTAAREAMAADLYPYFVVLDGHEGTEVRYQGRSVVMCGSNNYLGLTTDPRVKAASQAATDEFGTSCTGSRFLNGNLALHEQLERELAAYCGKEEALVFTTGYQANLGAVSGLVGRGDHVLIDRAAHASAIDAAALSGARTRTFRHDDPASLRRLLRSCPLDAGRLVVVDGVYSMDGDVCSLPELLAECRAFGARLLLDDAHGIGVLGGGRGTEAHLPGDDEADLTTLTFSKSLASVGGAVLGSAQVVHYLRHHARSLIFSAGMSPANTAAALAALGILREEPWRVERLHENAAYLRAGLLDLGIDVGTGTSPIVPVFTADHTETFVLWRRLLDRGVYVNAVVPPAASHRLRMSVMATHTPDQLDHVLNAFADVFADRSLAVGA
ncbi:aminotransferase class I/II-fold pyridoxal phosphate-dependent enzyme [Amycolatopsis sp. NPDC051102]|uniref:aminotransferase class I/II-fold pyridoxal phosphate-dependent enzyme n=1 Tax=Amycolatopsis sp. NPDC051102 TaxID=3155163 RepID=UPI003429F277